MEVHLDPREDLNKIKSNLPHWNGTNLLEFKKKIPRKEIADIHTWRTTGSFRLRRRRFSRGGSLTAPRPH